MNSSELIKGSGEEKLVGILLDRLGIVPCEKPRKQAPPEPDVCFSISEGFLVGVELTGIRPSDSRYRAIKPEVKSTLDEASRCFREMGKPAVKATFYLVLRPGDSLSTSRAKRRVAAIAVAEYVASLDVKPGLVVNLSDGQLLGTPLAALFINQIEVSLCEEKDVEWRIVEIASTPMATVPEIEERIRTKESRLGGYQTKYTETWLVIHNGFGNEPANAARTLPEGLSRAHEFYSSFSKVYFMSGSDGHHLLRTRRPT